MSSILCEIHFFLFLFLWNILKINYVQALVKGLHKNKINKNIYKIEKEKKLNFTLKKKSDFPHFYSKNTETDNKCIWPVGPNGVQLTFGW